MIPCTSCTWPEDWARKLFQVADLVYVAGVSARNKKTAPRVQMCTARVPSRSRTGEEKASFSQSTISFQHVFHQAFNYFNFVVDHRNEQRIHTQTGISYSRLLHIYTHAHSHAHTSANTRTYKNITEILYGADIHDNRNVTHVRVHAQILTKWRTSTKGLLQLLTI